MEGWLVSMSVWGCVVCDEGVKCVGVSGYEVVGMRCVNAGLSAWGCRSGGLCV